MRLEARPGVIALAKTLHGKVLVAALCAGLLWLVSWRAWIATPLIILALSLFPKHRRPLVTLGTAYSLYAHRVSQLSAPNLAAKAESAGLPFLARHGYVGTVLVFAFAGLIVAAAHRWPTSAPMKAPVRNLLLAYVALLIGASYLPLPAAVAAGTWLFADSFGRLLWFVAYSLHDAKRGDRTPVAIQLGRYAPFWGSLAMPFAKGELYLQRIEAKTPEELATTQIKGLKLLAWAVVLATAINAFDDVVLGTPQPSNLPSLVQWVPHVIRVPTMRDALVAHAAGAPFPTVLSWLAIVANFVRRIMLFCVFGHTFVALCRLAGFRALRNTYRPLASPSLADFYNRISFYFKELLVDFFFYPFYLRYFREHPRLRTVAATAWAAGFGNVAYHFLRDTKYIQEVGFFRSLASFHVYMVYALVLSLAIGLSQLRAASRKERGLPVRRASPLASLGVMAFYCVVMVMDEPPRSLTILDYGRFAADLF